MISKKIQHQTLYKTDQFNTHLDAKDHTSLKMINKRISKTSMAAHGTKKKDKLGKTKAGKKTMFSKEEGAVFKKPVKKVKSLLKINSGKKTLFSKEDIPIVKKSSKNTKPCTEKNHDSQEPIRAEPKKQKNYISTDVKTSISNCKKKKKRREMGITKAAIVSEQPEEEMEQMQTTTDMGATKKKKKKKRKLASGRAAAAAGGLVSAAGGSCAGHPARLSVAGGFSWETTSWPQLGLRPTPADDSSSDDDDDTQQQPAAQLSRQQLRERAAAEERQLVERERRLMDPTRAPETADDHERLVVAHPDDSSLWIRFMSYFLQATEIEKARGVARRALKTINFREEDEKLNVYVAWLNLESMHGTQETLSNVLHEALQCNDAFKVYTRMAEIHQANSKYDEAELMYSQLVKKLAASKEAWLRYGVFLMQVERREAARALMQRALKCLDRRDHVEVISKFAQLEFRFGEPERGKTMFDHLLSTYPKRLDQWNVYVNQLIKSGDYDSARRIFQRAVTVRLNARRVRSLLKRFLEFEQAHGTAEQQEAVREMARQYVETRSETDAALLDTAAR